jgi:hypothetical protein
LKQSGQILDDCASDDQHWGAVAVGVLGGSLAPCSAHTMP